MIFEKAGIDDLTSLVELRMSYLTEDCENLSEFQKKQILEKLPNYYRNHLDKDFFCLCLQRRKNCWLLFFVRCGKTVESRVH